MVDDVLKLVNAATCILLDIEGTTTSIHFVKKELFPYSEKHLEEYVKEHWNDDEMHKLIDLLIKEQDLLNHDERFIPLHTVPSDSCNIEEFQNKVISHLQWQIGNDCKTTGLKKLQGYIWKHGYATGLLQGHVYEDVPVALKEWKSSGKKIYIYSSGSIDAQKLLFHNSIKGNLDKFIDGNFDTTVGSKLESKSYSNIINQIAENPENVVFFTDRPREVVAAKESGMKVILMIRENDNPFIKLEEEYLGEENGRLETFSSILN